MAVYRILKWEKYKKLALAFKPPIIYYSRDPHPTCKPPWGLKLIFYHGFDGYVFTDYAEGEKGEKHKDAWCYQMDIYAGEPEDQVRRHQYDHDKTDSHDDRSERL